MIGRLGRWGVPPGCGSPPIFPVGREMDLSALLLIRPSVAQGFYDEPLKVLVHPVRARPATAAVTVSAITAPHIAARTSSSQKRIYRPSTRPIEQRLLAASVLRCMLSGSLF
jgi:hypothetical protein